MKLFHYNGIEFSKSVFQLCAFDKQVKKII